MSMKEDRAREGKKAKYRKIGLGPAMDRGDIDFGDKHPLTKKRLKNFKKKENPMADERFYQTAKKRLMGSGISANKIGKYNDTPNKFDASRIAKKAGGGMSVGQAKIAAKAPPPNKIDAKDFAVLRQEKARGRGMGLQDEKVKPGKVMKARVGRSVTRIPLAGKSTSVGSTTMKGMKFSDKAKMVDAGKINKATGKFTSMEALRESVGYRPGESTSEFKKRRMKTAGAMQALKASRIGKIALGVGAIGLGAKKYLESKMKKKKDVKKKMGGGMMMQRPMGYKGGGMDMGKEPTSKMKTRETMLTYANAKAFKNKGMRLTDRDIEKARSLVKGKMGGGMMKPMGYSTGGPMGRAALSSSKTKSKDVADLSGKRRDKYKVLSKTRVVTPSGKEKPVRKTPIISRSETSSRQPDGTYKTTRFSAKAYNQKNSTEPTKFKDIDSRVYGLSKGSKKPMGYMSGGMMKPMGYKHGTSVTASCKLGRNKPTKIT